MIQEEREDDFLIRKSQPECAQRPSLIRAPSNAWPFTEPSQSNLPFIFHEDPYSLLGPIIWARYLVKQSTINRRLARWTLDLAEYESNLVHRPGKLNAAPDELSRLSMRDRPLEDLISKEDAGCTLKYLMLLRIQDSLRSYQTSDLEFQRVCVLLKLQPLDKNWFNKRTQ